MKPSRTAVTIGPALTEMLDLARAAGLSTLLVGRHGIGKSEIDEPDEHSEVSRQADQLRERKPHVVSLACRSTSGHEWYPNEAVAVRGHGQLPHGPAADHA